jgi:hypothetical protein
MNFLTIWRRDSRTTGVQDNSKNNIRVASIPGVSTIAILLLWIQKNIPKEKFRENCLKLPIYQTTRRQIQDGRNINMHTPL